MGGFNSGSGRGGSGGGSGNNNSPGTTQSGGNVGGSSNRDGPKTKTPKKTDFTKPMRAMRYGLANLVPGMKKSLIKNRKDYKEYLSKRGNTPEFLNVDDDTLVSFDTFEKVRNYKPTQKSPRQSVLNYEDYLAEEKGNFNLKYSGNVGGTNNQADGMANQYTKQGIELAKSATGSATILGPQEIQKAAANTTETKMSAGQINVANKRRGRKTTMLTSAKGIQDDYTLSKKTLLG
tara:strand:+ start:227 stop:928 length:702 start_codon:yes stop_codon:yes gene_type:complete